MSDGTLSEDSDTPEIEMQALVKAPKASLSSLKNGIYHTLMKEILKAALESHTEKLVNRMKGFTDGRDVRIQKTIAKVRCRLDMLESSLQLDVRTPPALAGEEKEPLA